ncbi:RNA recognition motif domain [Macleaya cordata]|uniref:RNA recognition motif domain n=1 Tax=Macleaya cordata TaxID=56857 RepID=A0A200RDY4_MACCD|nr:RNA recognition motif domain [Macleaya cordata]
MAIRLLWVPTTFSRERNPPIPALQKPSKSLTSSVSSLFFSNSSISPISDITTRTTRTSKNLFVFQLSSSTQQQSYSSNPTLETPTTQSDNESRTRLLAQNVPWSCTTEDIRNLFEKHGTVVDVELSMHNKTRNRGLAFVTMGSEEEAAAALTNLEAYELEGRTLKLAYAHTQKKKKTSNVPNVPKYNVFVGNLSWKVTSAVLREFFSSMNDNVVSAEVIYQTTDSRRSTGYGFVSFRSKEEAEAAISAYKGKTLMGRPIRLARSRRKLKEEVNVGTDSEETSTEVKDDEGLSD